MITMVEDPILSAIQTANPEAFRTLINEFVETLPAAIASYSGLPEQYVRRLAESNSSNVRAEIAGRTDCPSDVIELLAKDSDESVRSRVAGNPNSPLPLIRSLVADPNEWVRREIARRSDVPNEVLSEFTSDRSRLVRSTLAKNPNCPKDVFVQLTNDPDIGVQFDLWRNPALTDEMRAVLALEGIDSPDEVRIEQAWRQSGTWPADEGDLRTLISFGTLSAEDLRSVFDQLDSDRNTYAVRSALADNEKADKELLADLVRAATDRWEWRSLWARYFGHLWPSTLAFASVDVSDEAIAILNAAGHPAGLLRTDLPAVQPTVDPAAGLAQLILAELLVRALWRELALTGTRRIQAWNDNVDGDKFYLDLNTSGLSEGPIGYLFGGYSENREWAELEDYLTEDDAQRTLSNFGEELEFDSVAKDDLDAAMCAAISFASENTGDVTITKKGATFIQQVALELDYLDREDMSTRVVIRESELPQIGFGALSAEKQGMLVDFLLAARSHVLIEQWRLADHALACIQVHPQAASDVVSRIEATGFTN
jgi:hypothetical protein